MKILLKTLLLLAVPHVGCAQIDHKPKTQILEREEHVRIVQDLKKPAQINQLVRLITDEPHEVPDPTRPLLIELPNGQKKYVIGFSGQKIMMVNSLKDLIYGGVKPTREVELLNEFGFRYGGEIDPATGIPWGYASDSSTWDVSVFRYRKEDGETGLKVLAGAMGTGPDGKPYLIKDGYNNTRQRIFFDAEFREVSKYSTDYKLHAHSPKAILNSGRPVEGNWIQRNSKGEIIFSHGYGGEPVTLLNGDLFIDERGWVPFVHEIVVEQREEADSTAPGGIRKIPYRTAIVVTYLDKTLSKVMRPAKIIFDVFKKDGTIWSAAQRPTAGPLVEGAHIEVQYKGKPVESIEEVRSLLKAGYKFDFQMLFSAGEYFGHYGSYMAYSKGSLENFEPVTDDKGELLDLTAPLRVLFTWIGRPVSFYAEGKEYLMIHGVDRTSLPRGTVLDQLPKENEWPYFRRQEIIVPVERSMRKGIPEIRIKDDSGLIKFLQKFTPRKVSFNSALEIRRVGLKTVVPSLNETSHQDCCLESHLG